MSSSLRFCFLASFALAACGENPGANPCSGDNPAAECAMSCADGCPFGFYCDATSGECTADCDVNGDDCGEDEVCNATGQCQAQEDPIDCPDVSLVLTPRTPTVVLLVDQSGSMNSDLSPGVSRWDATKTALLDPTTGVVANMESRINFGASLYSSNGGNAGGVCPIMNESLPTGNGYQAIKDLFDANSPNADTPTAESIDAVVPHFDSAEGPHVIVLATDGSPDNCVDSNAHNAESMLMSVTAVQNAFNAGISTFVLSVGTGVALDHLADLANAGQGLDLDTGTAEYFVATDPSLLQDAFQQIITGVRTCEVDLDQPIDPARAFEGTVTLNGADLEFGVDWQLVDDNTIELIGTACDTLLNDDFVNLEASFPCGVVIE